MGIITVRVTLGFDSRDLPELREQMRNLFDAEVTSPEEAARVAVASTLQSNFNYDHLALNVREVEVSGHAAGDQAAL